MRNLQVGPGVRLRTKIVKVYLEKTTSELYLEISYKHFSSVAYRVYCRFGRYCSPAPLKNLKHFELIDRFKIYRATPNVSFPEIPSDMS